VNFVTKKTVCIFLFGWVSAKEEDFLNCFMGGAIGDLTITSGCLATAGVRGATAIILGIRSLTTHRPSSQWKIHQRVNAGCSGSKVNQR